MATAKGGEDPLSAAQRGKIRRLANPGEPSPEEEGGELNVVPFLDIITNVLMFVLATVAITFTATIETAPPRGTLFRGDPNDHALGLAVIVVRDGFSIKARGGNVAPGCSDTGAGLAVPKRGIDYDFGALKACATKIKGAVADRPSPDRDVIISANPDVPYEVVIATLDAVRRTEEGKDLFPDVTFGVAR